MKLLITAPHLKDEQQRAVYEMLTSQVQTYAGFQDHSTDERKGVEAMTEAIVESYMQLFKNVRIGRETGNAVCVEV